MGEILADKVAVVTGGGSGIGHAVAARFASEGAYVCILDNNPSGGETIARDIQGRSSYHLCDVSNYEEVERVFRFIAQEHGPINMLVNSAGIASVGTIEECSSDELDRVYRVNVSGTANCLRAAVRQMKNQGGSIVNIASVASHVGIPDRFAYSMSKGAVLAMTLSVAADFVNQGIRCNSVSPARIHTAFVDGFIKKSYPGREEEMLEKLSTAQPIGRMGKPEEVAGLALFLCSSDAEFITGSDLTIDGGYVKLKST